MAVGLHCGYMELEKDDNRKKQIYVKLKKKQKPIDRYVHIHRGCVKFHFNVIKEFCTVVFD